MDTLKYIKEKHKLMKLIQLETNKWFNNIHTDYYKEFYEDFDITIEFEKSIVLRVINDTINKYRNDYSSTTYHKLIDYVNYDGDYYNDELESEVYDKILEELKSHPNTTNEWCDQMEDLYIGEGFINTLLHYFRLFYQKWFLEDEINKKFGELHNSFEIKINRI